MLKLNFTNFKPDGANLRILHNVEIYFRNRNIFRIYALIYDIQIANNNNCTIA